MKNPIPYTWENHSLHYSRPGADSSDSLPLGNGDLGINAWVEENGDFLFYIAKSDALTRNNQLIKLGRVRLSFDPNPFLAGEPFEMCLEPERGRLTITAGKDAVRLECWVDAHQPMIFVRAESTRPFTCRASLENWRLYPRSIHGVMVSPWDFEELLGVMEISNGPEQRITLPADTVFDQPSAVLWAHVNPKRTMWDDSLERSWCGAFKNLTWNPLGNRISGAVIELSDGVSIDSISVASSAPVRQALLQVTALSDIYEDPDAWKKQVLELAAEPVEYAARLAAHEAWWREQFERHYIEISGDSDAAHASMCYLLQRYMTLCAARGIGPIHFNGSIFNVDWHLLHDNGISETYNADYRRWGNTNLVQNTRLPYWGMLCSGDHAFMDPFFAMYRRSLPLAKARCQQTFGHGGAFFYECMSIWGTQTLSDLHKHEKPEDLFHSMPQRYVSPILEVLAMALDYYAFSQDPDFPENFIFPVAEAALTFYLQHFTRDDSGRLRIEATCLEQYHESVNPLPDVAGLGNLCEQLPTLSDLPQELKSLLQQMEAALPELPLRAYADEPATMQSRIEERWKPLGLPMERPAPTGDPDAPYLAAAEEVLTEGWNVENPELYAIFPYRRHAIGNGDLALARRSFHNRLFHHDQGWAQDSIQAAMLGLAEEARSRILQRYRRPFPQASFPAFWDANFDWIPDQDNGGVANKALQAMLIQYHGDQIFLFPAWPAEWNVRFKVYGPRQTVIEGSLENGKLTSFHVQPAERAGDVFFIRSKEQVPVALGMQMGI